MEQSHNRNGAKIVSINMAQKASKDRAKVTRSLCISFSSHNSCVLSNKVVLNPPRPTVSDTTQYVASPAYL